MSDGLRELFPKCSAYISGALGEIRSVFNYPGVWGDGGNLIYDLCTSSKILAVSFELTERMVRSAARDKNLDLGFCDCTSVDPPQFIRCPAILFGSISFCSIRTKKKTFIPPYGGDQGRMPGFCSSGWLMGALHHVISLRHDSIYAPEFGWCEQCFVSKDPKMFAITKERTSRFIFSYIYGKEPPQNMEEDMLIESIVNGGKIADHVKKIV